MFDKNYSTVKNKRILANLVIEHLTRIGFDAELLENKTNSQSHKDRVLVNSKQLGLIHVTATPDVNPVRINVYGKVGSPHLADKEYFSYGWNTEQGISIYFLKKKYIEGNSSFKTKELISLSEDYLTLTKSKEGKYSNPVFVDQFSNSIPVEKEQRITNVYIRSPIIRKKVLHRAQGLCEFCQQEGFVSNNDNIYLETHHIIPLSENGSDTIDNLIALCPNDHRKSHFEKNTKLTRPNLLDIVKNKIGE
jgi:hypothetical protein